MLFSISLTSSQSICRLIFRLPPIKHPKLYTNTAKL
jgi:hypothetical protein